MPLESHEIPKVMRIHLLITQYPILAEIIRERMRQEIFRRGIISRERLEQEAREKAILSQHREGISTLMWRSRPRSGNGVSGRSATT